MKFKLKKPSLKTCENNELFPIPTRCLIIGSSGSGKTFLLYNIITQFWIPYKNLHIFTKSKNQPIYDNILEIFENLKEISVNIYENCEEMITVDECEPDSLVIFDDCLLENQAIIREYFVRGRPKNISCFYLSQCYSKVDPQVIRNNSNFFIIFNQNGYYTHKIYNDIVRSDMTFNDFQNVCRKAWNVEYGFLCIDMSRKRYKFKDVDDCIKKISL